MLESLFENVGKKIKSLVKILFIIEVISAIIGGLYCFTLDVGLALATIVFGSIAALITSWFLYGFGEIIDRCCSIDENLEEEKYNRKTAQHAAEANELPDL